MKEVKPSRKPMIYYYAIVVIALLLFNFLAVPFITEREIRDVDYGTFFRQAPRIHPNYTQIRGVVCGCRVETIEDPLMRQIRCLDKLVDELAKGKAMDKILRNGEETAAPAG